MKTKLVWFVIFLICRVVCDNQKSSQSSLLLLAKTPEEHLQKSSQDVEPSVQKSSKSSSSVEKVQSTNSFEVKELSPKTETHLDVPSSHSDFLDVTGETMFSRAAYLLTGISVLVLLYFAWKSFSLRRRQTHIHKYGVVANREDLEMTSLGFGSEDEEDDTTHFDIGKHQRL